MENASKALLMASGILIGILILTLMVVLFMAGNETFSGYEETKSAEAVQRFNTNFTKYVGKHLTAHEVLTICNFAKDNTVNKVTIRGEKDIDTIKTDINTFTTNSYDDLKKYTITVDDFTPDGYVNKITISSPP